MIDLAIIHSRHWAGLDVTDDEYSEVIDRAIAAEEENESLKSRLQAAESKLEEMANNKAEPISYEQMIDHEWVKISKARFEQLEGCSWIQKRELYLHPQVQSNADKEIDITYDCSSAGRIGEDMELLFFRDSDEDEKHIKIRVSEYGIHALLATLKFFGYENKAKSIPQ